MLQSEGVGVDLMSALKTVNRLSELAIENLAKYKEDSNTSHLAQVGDCLREMNEFLGDGKLLLMAVSLGEMSKKNRR